MDPSQLHFYHILKTRQKMWRLDLPSFFCYANVDPRWVSRGPQGTTLGTKVLKDRAYDRIMLRMSRARYRPGGLSVLINWHTFSSYRFVRYSYDLEIMACENYTSGELVSKNLFSICVNSRSTYLRISYDNRRQDFSSCLCVNIMATIAFDSSLRFLAI